jgi:hypothetical protein
VIRHVSAATCADSREASGGHVKHSRIYHTIDLPHSLASDSHTFAWNCPSQRPDQDSRPFPVASPTPSSKPASCHECRRSLHISRAGSRWRMLFPTSAMASPPVLSYEFLKLLILPLQIHTPSFRQVIINHRRQQPNPTSEVERR